MKRLTKAFGIGLTEVAALLGGLSLGAQWKARRAEAKYPPSGEFVVVDGCRYHYKIAGTGMPVVLVHGTGASFQDYDYGVFEELAANFRVVAVDRPGHGYSQRRNGDIGTPMAQAGLVHEVVRQVGIPRAIIVGHSWSGALALSYALQFPADTAGVVVVQGTLYRDPEMMRPVLRLLSMRVVGPILAYSIMPFAGQSGIRQSVERAFYPDPVPTDYLDRALAMWTRPAQARAIAIDARRRFEVIDELSRQYSAVTCPVRGVVGARDELFDPSKQLLRLTREVPSVHLDVIADAGHEIPQTRPAAVVEAVGALAADLKENGRLNWSRR